MAPPRSRMRKQQRKKIDRTPWLILSSSLVVLFIFYLSSIVIDDSALQFDNTGSLEKDMASQCRESCSAVILSREEILSATSPGSLAFSAVDALFSFREGDEEDYSSSSTTIKRQKQGEPQSRSARQGKNNVIPSHNDMYKNLSLRPTRLPPLIAALVGTIDGHEDFEIPLQGDLVGGARQGDNDRIHSPNGHEVGISSGSGDDSVAMVAAAAAAALWSESESRQGRLRMKAFNDEWESSLRWIASWGQQSHGNKSTMEHSSINSSRTSQYISKGSSRQKRQKGVALGKEAEKHLNTEENSGFSELLDACVAQCSGGTRVRLKKDSSVEHVNADTQSNGRDITFRAIIYALKSLSSPFVYSSDYFRSLQANIQIIKSLFGVAVSTAMMLGIRNVAEWWRHKTSLRLLLEEEDEEISQEKMDCGRNRKNKARISKKSRQRRNECPRVVKSYDPDCLINTLGSEGHEDASVRSESSSESMSFCGRSTEREHTLRSCVDNHSIDRGRGHASLMSTTSCISRHEDDEYCLIQPSSNNSKLHTENTAPVMHILKQRKSKRKKAHVTRSRQASSRRRNLAQAPPIRKAQLEIKHHIPELTRTGGATLETESLTKSDLDAASITTPENPNVPTEEQREKASRLLREFQLTQVQKYIKSKKVQSNLSPKITNLHAPVQVDSCRAFHKEMLEHPPDDERMEIVFNPGSPADSNVLDCTDMVVERSLDTGADVDQSILNMLDESDEELRCEVIPRKKTMELLGVVSSEGLLGSPLHTDKKSPKGQNKIRSIALGGLLTSKNNTSSSVSSNPWGATNVAFRNESPTLSFENSSVHSQEPDGHTTEYTDANICLQVSAREFSPSWDKGINRGNHEHVW